MSFDLRGIFLKVYEYIILLYMIFLQKKEYK
jgi:hypothetical protein